MDGIPYVIYKRCPDVFAYLVKIFSRIWDERVIPLTWRLAWITLLAKTSDLNDPKNFRPIALLNTSGKIFFSLVNKRLSQFLAKNGYISQDVQKGFQMGVAGCVEHSAKLVEVLQHAHQHQRQVCVSWLDLENAYGSTKHNLLQYALSWYYVPKHIRQMIFSYYDYQAVQVVTKNWTTDWIALEKGVFQGCTLSPTLFNIQFNMMLDRLRKPEIQKLCYNVDDQADDEPAYAYADDVELITQTPDQMQLLLDELQDQLDWSRCLKLKPIKCRSLAFRSFTKEHAKFTPHFKHLKYSAFDPQLVVSGKQIDFIRDDPFKYLGVKVYADFSISKIKEETIEKLQSLLALVDGTKLVGWMKLWLYNHYIVTKLSWFLMMYDFSFSFVSSLEKQARRYLKKWSGLARCANVQVLYQTHRNKGLNLKNVVTFFKQMQLTKLLLIRSSTSEVTRRIWQRKLEQTHNVKFVWVPVQAARSLIDERQATRELNIQDQRRLGLGYQTPRPKDDTPASLRKELSVMLREREDKEHLKKVEACLVRGSWSRWNDLVAQDLRWNVFFNQQIKQNEFKWLLNGMQNTLPSEQNLALWKYKTGSSCVLCGEQQPPSLIHVLNCCTVALKQGRYTMRHDSVLACLEPALRRQLDAINTKSIRIPDGKIRFVKEGAAPRKELSNSSFRPSPPSDPFTRLLGRHRDWQLLVDLAGSPSSYSVMPPQIAAFSGRPDLIVYSESGKVVLFAELTIPSPTGISAAERRKLLRYKDLAQACQPGWKCFLRTVEVSSLGFLGVNMHMFLKSMFLPKYEARQLKADMENVVRRCSYYVFLSRQTHEWAGPAYLHPTGTPKSAGAPETSGTKNQAVTPSNTGPPLSSSTF